MCHMTSLSLLNRDRHPKLWWCWRAAMFSSYRAILEDLIRESQQTSPIVQKRRRPDQMFNFLKMKYQRLNNQQSKQENLASIRKRTKA